MKIVLLAAANNIHTFRWAQGLSSRGHEVHLISAHNFSFDYPSQVHLHPLRFSAPFGYIANIFQLNHLLKLIGPDILNIHYASGYGLLGTFAKEVPTLISTWGSDVYEFPRRSLFHKKLLVFILSRATAIASTSTAMAKELKAYSDRNIYITPFGVDVEKFRPKKGLAASNMVTIGTTKALASIYGIDTLLLTFTRLLGKFPQNTLKLVIAGKGPQAHELKELAAKLGIGDAVHFLGEVSHERVPDLLNTFDIFVALSNFESFGVSILEAMACELPVVVSDADGPKEIVANSDNGFVVPRNNPEAAAKAIMFLIDNTNKRLEMGKRSREIVLEHYSWEFSVSTMVDVFQSAINSFRKISR